MKFRERDLQDVVGVVDNRIDRALDRRPRVEYGTVGTVTGSKAAVKLLGSTVESEGFNVPPTFAVETGDRVRVVINPNGDRFVAENLTALRIPSGRGMEFVPITPATVLSTSVTVSTEVTSTGTISEIPADAEAVDVLARCEADTAHFGHRVELFSGLDSSNKVGEAWAGAVAGFSTSNNVTVPVSGQAFYYDVRRAAGSVTAILIVTGYWHRVG